jgi:hypothetical protein
LKGGDSLILFNLLFPLTSEKIPFNWIFDHSPFSYLALACEKLSFYKLLQGGGILL